MDIYTYGGGGDLYGGYFYHKQFTTCVQFALVLCSVLSFGFVLLFDLCKAKNERCTMCSNKSVSSSSIPRSSMPSAERVARGGVVARHS